MLWNRRNKQWTRLCGHRLEQIWRNTSTSRCRSRKWIKQRWKYSTRTSSDTESPWRQKDVPTSPLSTLRFRASSSAAISRSTSSIRHYLRSSSLPLTTTTSSRQARNSRREFCRNWRRWSHRKSTDRKNVATTSPPTATAINFKFGRFVWDYF